MNILMHRLTNLQVEGVLKSKRLNSVGIVGAKGSGKGFLAKYISQQILGVKDIDTYPYIFKLDANENQVGIEQVREIKDFLKLKIPGDKQMSRIIIVENIDKLSISAQNALLKTIEEPPKDTLIITTADGIKNILPTIKSRQQWIICRPIEKDRLFTEFDKHNKELVEKAYLLSEGKISSFYSLLHNEESGISISSSMDFAKNLLRSNRSEKLANIDKIIKSNDFTPNDLLDSLAKIIKLLLKNDKSNMPENFIKKLEAIYNAQDQFRYNLSAKLILTNLFNKL